ncbi:MAG: cytochrome c3 family protein [Calditrichaeota bacterium]|nr:cytochrome c3 family protein [Calditrichota bacterium]MCB9367707.1 cytochrome c3 family protein [Calditrichota bacterium]
MKKYIFILLAVLTVALFANAGPEENPKSAFSHGLHVDENGMACTDCHSAAASSTTGKDNLLPKWAVCSECHTADDIANKGVQLGEAKDGFVFDSEGAYLQKFPHQKHVKDANLECAVCHGNLDEPVMDGKLGHFPRMPQCIECHTERNVAMECNTCHMPDDKLTPEDHDLLWTQRHGISSTMSDAQCMMCHRSGTELDCQACHQGDVTSKPHPENYIFSHGQDAHLSDMRCATCHEQRSFCLDCHRDMNVLPADHFRAGFLTMDGGTHGEFAQFDLESCMSCHDTPNAEPTCARCHDAK